VIRASFKRGLSADCHWTGAASRTWDGQFTDSWQPPNLWSGGVPQFYRDNASSLAKSTGALDVLGTTGWARLKPGKPGASVGQAIAELRDGTPTIPGSQILGLKRLAKKNRKRLEFHKNLGSEYLNIQFGWLPFLNDLREMYHTWNTLDQKLAQLKRDNGKPVRRRGKVSSTSNTTLYEESSNTYMYPILTNEYYVPGSPGHRTVMRTETDSSWFSARFRYWIPDIGTSQWTRRAKAALFGLNPSPSLLWEVLPWSWLIDWFSNTGDVLSNISTNAAENLAADYAFIMSHHSISYMVEQKMPVAQHPYELSVNSELRYEAKQRSKANPYGFGLTFDDLSGRQMLILSALGLSRS
jgi:hypothetical protein